MLIEFEFLVVLRQSLRLCLKRILLSFILQFYMWWRLDRRRNFVFNRHRIEFKRQITVWNTVIICVIGWSLAIVSVKVLAHRVKGCFNNLNFIRGFDQVGYSRAAWIEPWGFGYFIACFCGDAEIWGNQWSFDLRLWRFLVYFDSRLMRSATVFAFHLFKKTEAGKYMV